MRDRERLLGGVSAKRGRDLTWKVLRMDGGVEGSLCGHTV